MPEIFTEADVRRMSTMYFRDQMSFEGIARVMQCHRSTVATYFRRYGIKATRSRSRTPRQFIEHIDFLYWGLGMSTVQIGREIGMTQSGVAKMMAAHDIPRRPMKEAVTNADRSHQQTPEYKAAASRRMKHQWETGNLRRVA